MSKKQQMQGFLNKAATIIAKTEAISPTHQKYIPSMSESANMLGLGGGGGNGGNYENYDNYTEQPYDQQQQYQQQPPQQQYQQQPGGYSQAAKKLPSSIYESIASNPIEEYQGSNMGGLSVLDSIMPQGQQQRPQQQQQQQRPQQRQQVNEDYEYGEKRMPDMLDRVRNLKEQKGMGQQEYQQPYQQQGASSSIDYSLIKMMIKDAIAEEFVKLKKTMINESRQNADGANNMVIKVGSDIKFMTNKGDIYTGNLNYVGKTKI